MIVSIHQTLHGYDRGHRLLARSVELNSDERYRIDRLSDLSGYPGREDPPPYLSGYPCGRYYVIARTWIDVTAERRGTVWTHSLLIASSEIADIADIHELTHLFRCPEHPVDLTSYEQLLSARRLESAPPVLAAHIGNLVGWFEREDPMVLVDGDFGEQDLRALWWCLPPADRVTFAFCTHALLPRYAGDKAFEWIATTPEAVRLFGDAANALRVIRAQPSTMQPDWIEPLLARGPQVWSQLRDRGFRLPVGQRRLGLKYEHLRSRGDVASILGCIDLIRLLPGEGVGAEAEDLVRCWLLLGIDTTDGLAAALDILARDPVQLAPALREQLATSLWEAIKLGAPRAPPWQVRAAWDTAGQLTAPARQAVIDAAVELDIGNLLIWLTEIVDVALPIIEQLPGSRRRELADALRERPSQRPLLHALAVASGDLEVLVSVAHVGDSELLDVATRIQASTPNPEKWLALLTAIGRDAVLDWWTQHPDPVGVRELAGFFADTQGVGASLDRPDAEHVRDAILLYASSIDVQHALVEHPERIRRAWVDIESNPLRSTAVVLARALRSVCDVETMFSLVDLAKVPTWAEQAWAPPLLDLLTGPTLRLALSERDVGALAALEQRWFEERIDIFSSSDWEWIGESAPIAPTACWLATVHSRRRRNSTRTVDAVRLWSQRPWASDEIVSALQVLLRALAHDGRLRASAFLLDRCLQDVRYDCASLVVDIFPIVHRGLCDQSERFGLLRYLTRWLDQDWDKAKHLRRALLRAFRTAGWPPSVLLDVGRSDVELWGHLVEIMSEYLTSAQLAQLVRRLEETDQNRYDALPRWMRQLV